MKKIISLVLLLITVATFSFSTPAWAGDAVKGAAVFSANCASCHMGGRNVVNAAKTLQKADLEKYEMYDIEKIKTQIMKGKAAMPAFKNITAEQVEDVATYVLSQADKGWK
ncbi:MAG: c-type cytochrome [Cyanobacteria bacterium]|uniref:cytochrome c6 PetJ n=1 Tax=Geminocystis sp. TaxID=2664100 RepID=UPI001DE5EE69|nr:c-type cytochrome [Cyanobacteria bacterium CG_2015-16_32_12]NCO77563.1 c-type cytochrome [Cyanobacteria bacterium CG_2015-22_32_23]NCQ03559.1 c-type cytochrome [Cyanobacteria bacterium CG_2015-09_32_10]NCQ40858.1 c-type cytochrome [Cyanobacteria bacterium CG_2015-04_32_10]NCS84850.1 c-type cytochrome [Cyanobacteria bacterium CG_2015-02_32_10]